MSGDPDHDLRNISTVGVGSYLEYLPVFDRLLELAGRHGRDKDIREQLSLMLKVVERRFAVHKEGLSQEIIPELQAILDTIRAVVEERLSPQEKKAVMSDIRKRLKERSTSLLTASIPASQG